MPPIILALGRVSAPPGAIIIDYRSLCFWKDGLAITRPWRLDERLACDVSNPPFLRFQIIASLLVRAPGLVAHGDMLAAIYGDHVDGGPLNAQNNVKKTLSICGLIFWKLGFRLENQWGVGYRLVPLPHELKVAA